MNRPIQWQDRWFPSLGTGLGPERSPQTPLNRFDPEVSAPICRQEPRSLGIESLWHPPFRRREDQSEVQQASSVALIVGIGLVQLLATRRGPVYEVRIVFPNFKVVEFGVALGRGGRIDVATTTPSGGVSTGETGVGVLRDPATSRAQVVRVSREPRSSGTLNLEFGNGTPPLKLIVTTREPEPGDAAIGVKVILQPTQPPYDEASGQVFRAMVRPLRGPVSAVHTELLSSAMVRGEQARLQTDEIVFSNGDRLEVTIQSWHHGKGRFQVRSARLNRFEWGEAERWADLEVSGEGSGKGRVKVRGEGYDLEIPVVPPVHSKGGYVKILLPQVVIRRAPEIAFREAAPVPAGFAREDFDPLKGVLLTPDEETARLLRYLPWESRPVELRFVGHVGGRKLGQDNPLVVKARLEGGKLALAPTLTEQAHVVFPGDGRRPLRYQVVGQEGDFRLQFPLQSGGALEAPSLEMEGLVGFGTDAEEVRGGLGELYHAERLLPQRRLTSSEWVPAEAETVDEIARFLSRSAVQWERSDAISQDREDPSLIRVLLHGGQELLMRRVELDRSIEYEVLQPPRSEARLSYLRLGDVAQGTLEGLRWQGSQGRASLRPWANRLSVFSWASDEVVYHDPTLSGLRVVILRREGGDRFKFSIPRDLPRALGGLLTRVEQDGRDRLVFEMGDGHLVRVTLPEGLDQESGLLLLSDPPQGEVPEIHVEELDARGQVVRAGRIVEVNGEWVFQAGGGSRAVLVDLGSAWVPVVRLTEPRPPVVAYRIAPVPAPPVAPVPPPEAPPAEAPPPEVVGEPVPVYRRPEDIAVPPLTRSFPWEPETFLLPAHETRLLMRSALDPEERPREGTRRPFVFYGEPNSPDQNHSARVILARMARHGQGSRSFFGWIFRVEMVFRGGQWVPDPAGVMELERRYPRRSGPTGVVIGNFQISALNGEFPIRPIRVGTGWGIEVGPGRVIQPFRSVLRGGGQVGVSPDFGLAFGEVTAAANRQLEIVEERTGVRPAETPARPLEPLPVEAVFDSNLSAHVRPEFGDPIYRTHADVQGNVTLIEFSPGLHRNLPDLRFSQLSIQDGNGFTWRLVFQHGGGVVRLVGAESMGRPLDLTTVEVESLEGGKARVSGILQASYRAQPGGSRVLGLPFEVEWSLEGDEFRIAQIQVGGDKFGLDGLRFDPRNWREADVLRAREGQQLEVRVTRVGEHHWRGGRGPVVRPPPVQLEVMVPEHFQLLARGQDPAGQPLPEGLRVDYRGEAGTIRMPLRFNPLHLAYEPVVTRGLLLLRIGRESLTANCEPTQSGRNWRLTLPDGRIFFLGNFYLFATGDVGRPVPVLWQAPDPDPHRTVVNRVLEERGLAPRSVTRVPLRSPTFVLTVEMGGQQYQIPMRVYPTRRGRTLVVPTGEAIRRGADGQRLATVNYYLPHRGSPAVLEVDGYAFELEIRGGVEQTQTLSLRRTHPGASAIYVEERSRHSVMLEPGDQSALLLVDIGDDSFEEAARAALETPQRLVRRQLREVISGRIVELVFEVQRDRRSQVILALRGVARLQEGGAEVMPAEVTEVAGRIYLRTQDGQFLSLPQYPGSYLQVSSHGRTLEAPLVRRVWEPLTPEAGWFSLEIVEEEVPAVELFFDTPGKRLAVVREVAGRFGVEEGLLWDREHPFPRGMKIHPRAWNPAQPQHRIFERGQLRMECDFRGGFVPVNLEILYGGQPIPYETFSYHGRPYLVLRGPLSGVTFYWAGARAGISQPTEVTHPALREALERDMGWEPLGRPKRVQGGRGSEWEYPEVEEELQGALARQVARSRLWRLAEAEALPADVAQQLRVSEVLIPEPQSYGPESRPPVLVSLEEMAADPSTRESVGKMIEGIGEGVLPREELGTLPQRWKDYKESRGDATIEELATTELTEEVNRLTAKVNAELEARRAVPPEVVPSRPRGGGPGPSLMAWPIVWAATHPRAPEIAARVGEVVRRGATRTAVGGIPFVVGDIGSNLILGRELVPFREIVTTYLPLAAGGGAARLGVDGMIRLLEGRTFLPSNAWISELSSNFVKGVARRGIPLFGALTLTDYVKRGHVDWVGMPVAMLNILIASSATHGLGRLLLRSAFVERMALALRLLRGAPLVPSPQRFGVTLLGACLASVTEFTLLKVIGDLEQRALTSFAA